MIILLIIFFIFLYIFATISSNRRYKKWPFYRTVFWILGVLFAASTLIGPIADLAHHDFRVHMIGHLFLGMLAPLLMVLAAPITLVLRTLKVKHARCLSSILKSHPMKFFSDPIIASILNVGGLWILYTTELYSSMHHNIYLHFFIHLHVFLAGYLFTASMIYIDPTAHRRKIGYRAIILVLALAFHGILSKYIYANPPYGISSKHAETGGILMYYGGDFIDAFLIFFLCLQWYKAQQPRVRQY
ncbi:cytochrome c oxidase assembly protein [Metabacillus litoralis]|uniref:cytochrome c oxidase assembly protein n=1 Tax=Metabacillus litoralis TaxID=152268 RepID=UPI0039B11E02